MVDVQYLDNVNTRQRRLYIYSAVGALQRCHAVAQRAGRTH